MATCDITDLDERFCSHCRGLDGPAAGDKERADGWTRARRTGRCPNCGKPIEPGEMVGLVGEQWWGECCAE